ncbi:MAG TPA: Asp-tRNA(Asn)/Glu-tRNA(Gln) amidotransferase subunit GatB [Spirochaetota bacterium]|nr:Asp-tRNA(Asn)/Glu-tRNA(Gln) amidotransferase subunit GatB [Spirochaetota bacterium]HRZ26837.1 Asp-tRNA(Asn)/Glu-tRNA(Gln) amidotransferase subunit GatB [Spirochaetota bacterium]
MSGSVKINIANLVELGSFEVDERERAVIENELAEFLEYARVLDGAPCGNVAPASHAVEKKAYLREDLASSVGDPGALLRGAPLTAGTSYLVPPQKSGAGPGDEEKASSAEAAAGDYEAVIGLEVHAQLKTRTKLFCSCSAEFGHEPNENTCPVCSGHPGVLPVLNREAVSMAIKAGVVMGCTINRRSVFERKNYFYPDLPKAYQISQYEEPLCSGGHVEIDVDGARRRVRLNRIHMEEDAGKLVHVGAPGIWGAKASAVDFNRCSVPLIEIVSEPDMSTPQEAREYVTMLRSILVSLGICDGNMEEGSLRCDANISLRPRGTETLGTKTEIKNMNSFKAIEKAVGFEIERQKKLLARGIAVSQETRLWDESSQKTYLMRSKEESHDYRYFPDPDLLPLEVDDGWVDSLKRSLPEMPLEIFDRCMNDYGFDRKEARLFMTNPSYARFFGELVSRYGNARNAANWFFNEVLSLLNGPIESMPLTPADMAAFLEKIDSGEISGKMGKSVLREAFESGNPISSILADRGQRQITDEAEIAGIVDRVLGANPERVREYREGKTQVFGFLVGLVMKESAGRANPALVNNIMKNKLD